MSKSIFAVVAGLIVWIALVSVAGLILRAAWPEYVAAAPAWTFTLSMKIVRLAIGALATVAAGWLTARLTRSSVARLMPGALLLLAFIPQHILLWEKFPVWYHLTFLTSLVPLTWLGARIADLSRLEGASLRART